MSIVQTNFYIANTNIATIPTESLAEAKIIFLTEIHSNNCVIKSNHQLIKQLWCEGDKLLIEARDKSKAALKNRFSLLTPQILETVSSWDIDTPGRKLLDSLYAQRTTLILFSLKCHFIAYLLKLETSVSSYSNDLKSICTLLYPERGDEVLKSMTSNDFKRNRATFSEILRLSKIRLENIETEIPKARVETMGERNENLYRSVKKTLDSTSGKVWVIAGQAHLIYTNKSNLKCVEQLHAQLHFQDDPYVILQHHCPSDGEKRNLLGPYLYAKQIDSVHAEEEELHCLYQEALVEIDEMLRYSPSIHAFYSILAKFVNEKLDYDDPELMILLSKICIDKSLHLMNTKAL